MTAIPPPTRPFAAAPTAGRRRIRTAVFGCYSRHMTGLYLEHVAITLFGLLTIALTIDLSQWLARLLADLRAEGVGGAALFVGRYVLLRSPDILGRLLPVGCFLGVLWCEIASILSRRRITVWITGRSTLQCLVPVVVLGAIAGVVQWGLETHLRPMVVAIQTAEHIGEFGDRFDRRDRVRADWLVAGHDVVRARVHRGERMALLDLLVVRSDDEGRVEEVVTADRATLAADGKWDVEAGMSLRIAPDGPRGKADRLKIFAAPVATGVGVTRLALEIDPVWLDTWGINAKYLPQSTLETLASRPDPTYPAAEYRTWVEVRIADFVVPFAMALSAAVLALVVLPNAVTAGGVATIALIGYSAHVAMRTLLSLGERGVVSPGVAAWATPTVMIAVAVAVLVFQARRIARAR